MKKVNFYTSTCFEGCDIYDERGRVYIVSDGNKRHTQLDISTLLIQICGRIRNSVYNDITHIFSYTRYKGDITVEEFEQKTLQDYEQSKRMIEELNQMDEKVRLKVIKELKASSSKKIKSVEGFERFQAWGETYATLSYSLRDKDMIIKYIFQD